MGFVVRDYSSPNPIKKVIIMRYTKVALKADIKYVNDLLSKSGSSYFYKYEPRNNYHAIDFCTTNTDGTTTEIGCLDCAEPPRILSDKMFDDYEQYMGKKSK